jgi:hypothetical protein
MVTSLNKIMINAAKEVVTPNLFSYSWITISIIVTPQTGMSYQHISWIVLNNQTKDKGSKTKDTI